MLLMIEGPVPNHPVVEVSQMLIGVTAPSQLLGPRNILEPPLPEVSFLHSPDEYLSNERGLRHVEEVLGQGGPAGIATGVSGDTSFPVEKNIIERHVTSIDGDTICKNGQAWYAWLASMHWSEFKYIQYPIHPHPSD